ncbi:MAG: hypothetical protein JNN30_16240 [Rhodanobacteraceae bacterium]|nr:hypothetical protein [Rhodanobacteraceae bacterium]
MNRLAATATSGPCSEDGFTWTAFAHAIRTTRRRCACGDECADVRRLMPVQDMLALKVREEEEVTDEISTGLCKCVSTAAELAVPLVVDIRPGVNRGEAHREIGNLLIQNAMNRF